MNVIQNNDARREVNGVEYHAVTGTNHCTSKAGERCAMLTLSTACCDDTRCYPRVRRDKAHIIWVKATP